MTPGALLRVTPDDPEYRRLVEAEARYWNTPHPLGIEALWERSPEKVTDRYVNERYTDSPEVCWEETVHRYGPFRRGLALGTSGIEQEARLLASNPALHMTFVDLSPGALERRAQLLEPRFPGRVATGVVDLNFLELPAESYDFIVSVSSMHHVINLEHLAWQINRGLTTTGLFFLQDYVGERRFQFAPEKKRLFEVLQYREALRTGRQPGVVWFDDADLSPFCGLRAHETLATLRTFLDEQEVRTAGTLLVPLLRHRAVAGDAPPARVPALQRLRRRLRGRTAPPVEGGEFLRDLISVGDAAADAGLLIPGNAFARYRKST